MVSLSARQSNHFCRAMLSILPSGVVGSPAFLIKVYTYGRLTPSSSATLALVSRFLFSIMYTSSWVQQPAAVSARQLYTTSVALRSTSYNKSDQMVEQAE